VFALHPAHVEPVIWITGRADMLGTLGFLTAFYALVRYRNSSSGAWLALSWCAYGAGIFAKEFCLVLPLVAIGYDLLLVDRPRTQRLAATLAPYLGWAIMAVTYYSCRVVAFGSELVVARSAAAPAPMTIPLAQREVIYLAHLFWPLTRWLPTGNAERTAAACVVLAVSILTLAAAAAWWRCDRERGAREARAALFFGVIWFLAGTLPFVVTYVSPRHLYLASVGTSIGLAALLVRFASRPPVFVALSAAVVIFCGAELRVASAAWREASNLSEEIGVAASEVSRTAATGEVLLLDVPSTLGGDCVNCVFCGAWVWAWASPFALRPPFQERDITRELIVLERPEAYFHPEAWSGHPSLAELRGYHGRIWVISTTAGHATTTEVPADRAVVALEHAIDREGGLLTGAPGSFEQLVAAVRSSRS
jgi:hypothetical protein